MKLFFSIPLFLILLRPDNAFAISVNDKTLYGDDNRRLVTELNLSEDATTVKFSKSILAQIPSWRITKNNQDSIEIETKDLKSGLNVCEGERFLDQPIVSACTAFLIGPKLIATAGHCVKNKFDCKKQTWVLDYDSSNDFVGPKGTITFSKDKTYECAELITSSESPKLDFALIRLDREVTGRTPLNFRRNGKTPSSESLMVIGHPLGMPKIMTDHIFIRDNSQEHSFQTNADTFSGNSGSPVIGVESGLVEGLLVRGDDDFKMDLDLGCQRPLTCMDKECRGESVQRSNVLPFKYIPKF
jgi:hypothetical protein